ncbi:MAG TPA: cysteate synthase [Methanospirillum sp.]|uniref:cysteate synthase n=1 Tax=Methanospirillum sp. TaxID=45200 RepID=UPI002CF91D26|nr:cysteate synthase [Methanospirillum sp.]HOJ96346.1 cysteate synthase [Methanospirillum sp.]HPP78795.1 cysteate synthase [Methanospirillum sp.]
MTGYTLTCPVCQRNFPDSYTLTCPFGCQGLIRTSYTARQIRIRNSPGIFRYIDWLPVTGSLPTRAEPVCYKSKGLAEALGLSDLWIVFSGYWPEKGAYAVSGSFKEFEAYPTVQRLFERARGIIQVSSAGNTGRAFAEVSARTGQPVIIVVPDAAQDRIFTTTPADHVMLITISGDYTDAISLGNMICTIPGVFPEGGAKNVARRDGMGTVMLAGTLAMGTLPDWYVQAVGSGTGGIAAYEASLRLIADGRFGNRMPRLLLFQNEPFIPMVKAWQERRREIRDEDMPDAAHAITQVYSDVLTNRTPPYGIAGGVFDTLVATNGIMGSVSSSVAQEAEKLFTSCEGIDLDPAAGVCVAGLIQAVRTGILRPDEKILLSITGGGYALGKQELPRFVKKPDYSVTKETPYEAISAGVQEWMKPYA